MSLFPETQFDFPNVSAYDSDLREVLHRLKYMSAEMRDFLAVNKITNAGAWDITKQYRAWTIVSDNNIGYISLKPVPKGIEITNTEYWGVVADYDILITDLSGRISTLETQMGAVNNVEIPNIKHSINTINESIEPIINRKYVFLGDSYNYWGGGWLDGVTTAMGISNFYDYTVSAHGFTTTNTWEQDITQFVVDHPDIAPDITDVVIVGGINDTTAAAVAALPTAVPSFCTYVKEHLPKAKITFCFVGNMRQSSTYWTADRYKNKIKAMEIIRRFISLAGGSYNEGCMNAMYSYSFFESDGIHPNNFGQYYGIIPAVVCALNNQDFDACFSYESGTEGSSTGHWIREDMISGRDRLIISNYQLTSGTTITANWQDIITLESGIAGTNHTPAQCWVQIMNYNDAPKYLCYARVRNGKVQIKLADPLNDHTWPTVVANTLTFIKEIVFEDPIQNCV